MLTQPPQSQVPGREAEPRGLSQHDYFAFFLIYLPPGPHDPFSRLNLTCNPSRDAHFHEGRSERACWVPARHSRLGIDLIFSLVSILSDFHPVLTEGSYGVQHIESCGP